MPAGTNSQLFKPEPLPGSSRTANFQWHFKKLPRQIANVSVSFLKSGGQVSLSLRAHLHVVPSEEWSVSRSLFGGLLAGNEEASYGLLAACFNSLNPTLACCNHPHSVKCAAFSGWYCPPNTAVGITFAMLWSKASHLQHTYTLPPLLTLQFKRKRGGVGIKYTVLRLSTSNVKETLTLVSVVTWCLRYLSTTFACKVKAELHANN